MRRVPQGPFADLVDKTPSRGEGRATTRTVSIGLEQLVSIERSKTRISGEVLDDFGTFFRTHDAMKG
jgi:hypothetical protein